MPIPSRFRNWYCRLRGFLRRQSTWLLPLLLVLAYPSARTFIVAREAADVPARDRAGLETQLSAQWLDLKGPTSRLLIALVIFGVGLACVWLAMSLLPVVKKWARGGFKHDPETPATDFKTAFLELDDPWKFAVFVSCWLGLLWFFAQCWAGASSLP